jgi:6-phosphogluconolactonase
MKIKYGIFLLVAVSMALPIAAANAANGNLRVDDSLVYLGTNTGGKSKGIYVYRFSGTTGKLTPLGLAAASDNPGFLAVDLTHRRLYAVNEIGNFEGRDTGSLSAYSIDPKSGRLHLLNRVDSGGSGPTHLAIDQTERWILAAHYGAGSVALFPIREDGSLGKAVAVLPHTGHSVDPGRQKEPHAHSVYFSPDNRFAVSADLGTDQIYLYRFDAAQGTLTPNQPPYVAVTPGSGPRHFAFNPDGGFAYVIQEMASTITAFAYDAAAGNLQAIQTVSTLPADFKGSSTGAEIFLHPNGHFLYGSNRGEDSIAVFAVDAEKGTLTPVQDISTEGKTPRSFALSPSGRYLIAANQQSDSLVVFKVDPATGRMTPTGQKEDGPTPTCVLFVPLSKLRHQSAQ